MAVLITSPCQNWGANVQFEEQHLSMSNTISLMVSDHCLLDFITISYLLLISDICSSILTFGPACQKWPILTTKKVNMRAEKKRLPQGRYWHVLFAKNGVQIDQIWPVWLHLYFTSGYRGFPPCTLSQHPDSRETGYSNVLHISMPDFKIYLFRHARLSLDQCPSVPPWVQFQWYQYIHICMPDLKIHGNISVSPC